MNNVRLLSHALSESTPGFGGASSFQRQTASAICHGRSSNSEQWTLSNHIGTHVDCPFHFSEKGKKISEYEPSEWIFSSPYLITLTALPDEIINLSKERELIPLSTDCLIIKTNFEKNRKEESFWKNNPGLSPELGEWLREHRPNIKIVGFDFISLTAYQNRELGRAAHRAFLAPTETHEGIRIIEDMKLSTLTAIPKKIIVSPLLVEMSDGAPVTIWGLYE